MYIACFDLEGVLTPEIWITLCKSTKIEELKLTTRDTPDYDALMKRRLEILKKNNITIKEIQKIIFKMDLLPGAKEFLDWIRSVVQIVIVTDSYIEFIMPFLEKLNYPTCFCHNLEIDNKGIISDYKLCIREMKIKIILTLKLMNYDVIAVGDSYNDISMLLEAKHGILFKPSVKVSKEFPQLPVVYEYSELKDLISGFLGISG